MNDASHVPTRYYRTENRKLTFRECWWLARGWRVLFLWVPKLLHVPLELGAGLPAPRPFEERWVDPATLPAEVREKLERKAHALMRLEFDFCHYHVLVGNLLTSDSGGCYMMHASGEIVATFLYARNFAEDGSSHQSDVTAFLTPLADGSMLVTTDQSQKLESPSHDDIRREPGASLEELFSVHRARVAAARSAGRLAPGKILETPELAEVVDAYELRSFEFHVTRGVWVPMTDTQVVRLRERKAAFDARRDAVREELPPGEEIDFEAAFLRAGGSTEHLIAQEVMHALAERERPANGRWNQRASLLMISLILFAAIAFFRWRWQTVVTTIVVLLFHEAGHYAAMRWFGYQNVRMFFIPGLGAAVSGYARFMPGYKRVIVALMGPVPGIVAGAICWYVGDRTGSAAWNLAAVVLVILNGFNLAPILPFDGGRIVDDTIFCRDPWLRAAFGALAGVLLMTISLWSREMFVLFILGAIVLMTVPRGFRRDCVARKLKAMGVRPVAGEPIGIERLEMMVREVAATKRQPLDPRTLKAEVIAVFDRWNVEPPSVGASTSLLAVYALSLIAAIVVLYLAVIFRPPGSIGIFDPPRTESVEPGK